MFARQRNVHVFSIHEVIPDWLARIVREWQHPSCEGQKIHAYQAETNYEKASYFQRCSLHF